MLLNFYLVLTVVIVVGIALLVFIRKLLKKIGNETVTKILTGIAVSVILIFGIAVVVISGTVYVVNEDLSYSSYVIYGSPEFEFSNGEKVVLDVPIQKSWVLNNSATGLIIEEVIYSSYTLGGATDDKAVLPMSYVETDGWSVDHFFDDIPPDEISVDQSTGSVSRYWLRTFDAYNTEYDLGYEDIEEFMYYNSEETESNLDMLREKLESFNAEEYDESDEGEETYEEEENTTY